MPSLNGCELEKIMSGPQVSDFNCKDPIIWSDKITMIQHNFFQLATTINNPLCSYIVIYSFPWKHLVKSLVNFPPSHV